MSFLLNPSAEIDHTAEERQSELYVECSLYVDGAPFGLPTRTRCLLNLILAWCPNIFPLYVPFVVCWAKRYLPMTVSSIMSCFTICRHVKKGYCFEEMSKMIMR